MAPQYFDEIDYQRLAKDEEGQTSHIPIPKSSVLRSNSLRILSLSLAIISSIVAGFFAGASWARYSMNASSSDYSTTTAPRIPIPYTQDKFIYSSPFSLPPPTGAGSSQKSEPIWDALVPSKFCANTAMPSYARSRLTRLLNTRWFRVF